MSKISRPVIFGGLAGSLALVIIAHAAPLAPLHHRALTEPYTTRGAPAHQDSVRRFLLNPHGDVDGLLLRDGTQVNFPAHMSRELTAAVKVADDVSIEGYRPFPGLVKAYVITNIHTGQRVIEREPGLRDRIPPHLREASLAAVSTSGKVEHLLLGVRGEVKGVILDNGDTIRVPPHASYRLGALLQVGQPIAASGYGSATQYGHALEAVAIGSSGQTLQPVYHQHRARPVRG